MRRDASREAGRSCLLSSLSRSLLTKTCPNVISFCNSFFRRQHLSLPSSALLPLPLQRVRELIKHSCGAARSGARTCPDRRAPLAGLTGALSNRCALLSRSSKLHLMAHSGGQNTQGKAMRGRKAKEAGRVDQPVSGERVSISGCGNNGSLRMNDIISMPCLPSSDKRQPRSLISS